MRVSSPIQLLLRLLPVSGLTVLSSLAGAQEWEYGVDVDLGVVRSDNVFLADEGDERWDTVYLVSPEFYAEVDRDRLEANLRYRPQAVFFNDYSESDEVYHQVDASVTGALIRDRFFVYLSAVNFQSVVTPEGQIPTNNLSITDNRADSTVYEVRPYLLQKLGAAELYASVAYIGTDYEESSFQTSDERQAYISLDNFSRQQGIAWKIDYEYRRVEYETAIPWDFQRASLNLGYWINGNTRLFASGGAETSFDNFFDSNMDADFWEAGFQYAPSQRLNLELAAGDRSYGTSFRGLFQFEFRRGEISFSYNEDPATRSELAFDRRPIVDDNPLDGSLDRPDSADRFVLKRGEVVASFNLPKSEIRLRLFSEQREDASTAEGTPIGDERLVGLGFNWTWSFGSRTTLSVSADIADRESRVNNVDGQNAVVDDELSVFDIGLGYRLGNRTSLRLEAARSEQDGLLSGQQYIENQYRLLVGFSL